MIFLQCCTIARVLRLIRDIQRNGNSETHTHTLFLSDWKDTGVGAAINYSIHYTLHSSSNAQYTVCAIIQLLEPLLYAMHFYTAEQYRGTPYKQNVYYCIFFFRLCLQYCMGKTSALLQLVTQKNRCSVDSADTFLILQCNTSVIQRLRFEPERAVYLNFHSQCRLINWKP